MKKALVQIVRPADARNEVYLLCVVVIAVLACWTIAIHGRSREGDELGLAPWQVGAFHDLNTREQGLFAELRLAAEEIHQTYLDENGTWPRLSVIKKDGIAPFTPDAAWHNRGRLQWNDRVENNPGVDMVMLLGVSSDPKTTGSFLLEVHHHTQTKQDGPPYGIWYHPGQPVWPLATTPQSLANAGWKQVVAYTGENEVQRLKGTNR
jgi:hypothetical protein